MSEDSFVGTTSLRTVHGFRELRPIIVLSWAMDPSDYLRRHEIPTPNPCHRGRFGTRSNPTYRSMTSWEQYSRVCACDFRGSGENSWHMSAGDLVLSRDQVVRKFQDRMCPGHDCQSDVQIFIRVARLKISSSELLMSAAALRSLRFRVSNSWAVSYTVANMTVWLTLITQNHVASKCLTNSRIHDTIAPWTAEECEYLY